MIENPLEMAIESFLYRYSQLDLQNVLVRGSFVTRDWVKPFKRECRDVDFLFTGAYESVYFEEVIRSVIRCNDNYSGVDFFEASLEAEPIWENSPSPGMRFSVAYVFEGLEGILQIDTGCGDPLVEPPFYFKRTSTIPGISSFKVKTVIPEIALAWKVHGLFEHLTGWMSKTLWDVYLLLHSMNYDEEKFQKALKKAFESREDPVEIIKRLLFGNFGQSKSSRKSWLEFKEENEGVLPMAETLDAIRQKLLPLVALEDDQTLITHEDVLNYRLEKLRKSDTEIARMKLKTLIRKKRVQKWKAYQSIPHLPDSRTGESDRHIDLRKAAMLTEVKRESTDEVIVQEKLDGTCVAVAKVRGDIIALGRDGDRASESPNEGRRLFAEWVCDNENRFAKALKEGQRIVGEWLALVHSTRYKLIHEPFVAFDFFDEFNKRQNYDTFRKVTEVAELETASLLHRGDPISVEEALKLLGNGRHGSVDPPEGVVYRLERRGKFLFAAKFVRYEKVDGSLLPENSGEPAIWNWRPE